MMRLLTNLNLLQEWRSEQTRLGYSIALVPTMGNLHEGHLSLVRQAKTLADKVIVSIFVNPLQFGPLEDFDKYPRTESEDLERCKAEKVDAVFLPSTTIIYPQNEPLTKIKAAFFAHTLCGASRPGFFDGVVTVVYRLLQLIQPNEAIFGEKDYQQCLVISQMIKDLLLPVRIHYAPIVREANGLAMSSRNQYLSVSGRVLAPLLYEQLCLLQKEIKNTPLKWHALCQKAREFLEQKGFAIDYISLRDAETLLLPGVQTKQRRLFIAAWLEKTRLIDNLPV